MRVLAVCRAFFRQDASGLRAFWPAHVSCDPEVRTPATPQRASPMLAQSHLCHRWAPVHRRPHRRAHRRRHLSQLRQLQWQRLHRRPLRRAHRRSHLSQLPKLHSRTNATKVTSEDRMVAGVLGGSPSGPPQPFGALVLCATGTGKAAGPRGPREELHLWTVSSNGCRRGLRRRAHRASQNLPGVAR